jgi:flagellar biosynthesis regulator FlbT
MRLYVIYEISLLDNQILGLNQCFTTHRQLYFHGLMWLRSLRG